MYNHDEIIAIAEERLEDSKAELDNDFDKILGDNNIHSDEWRLDVSPEHDKITGTVHVDGSWVNLVAALDTPNTNWSIEVGDQKLTIPAIELEDSLIEIEEARDNLASVTEDNAGEEIDHPDGEDEEWDD